MVNTQIYTSCLNGANHFLSNKIGKQKTAMWFHIPQFGNIYDDVVHYSMSY
jgi:hypothetical protein